jgi:hypothetical protein
MALDTQRQLLEDWRNRMRAAQQNLLDLHEDVTYKRLVDSTRRPRSMITGETRDALEPILEGLNELWQNVGLVRDVVDQAQAAYDAYEAHAKKAPWQRLVVSGPDEKAVAATIERLLNSESVTLPPVSTPLAQRKLGTAGIMRKTMKPDVLFSIMEETFGSVAGPVTVERHGATVVLDAREQPLPGDVLIGGIITRVAQIWRSGDEQLAELVEQLADAKARAEAVHVPVDSLVAAEQQLDGYKAVMRSDPLGAQSTVANQVRRAAESVLLQIEQMELARRNVLQQLEEARQLHARMIFVHSEAAAKYRERLSKIAVSLPDAYPAPTADSTVALLGPWLERLTPLAQEGRASAVVGLRRLLEQIRQQIALAETCLAQNDLPLRERSQLKDTFNCLQVKVSAEKLQVFPTVMAASTAAARALQHPTDLGRARSAIEQFRRALQ